MMEFACDGCSGKVRAAEEDSGKDIVCPDCGRYLTVPKASAVEASASYMTSEDVPPPPPAAVPGGGNLFADTLDAPKAADPSDHGTGHSHSMEETHGDSPANVPSHWDFLRPAKEPDEIGRLGKYRILSVLGMGGMGVVFHAEDLQLKRPVALKVMLPHVFSNIATARQRFTREAQATAAIEHDHIVTIYQVDDDAGIPYIAMQLLRGETLQKRLQREKKLPFKEVLRIGRETASGLAAAHQRGLMHRDIKPSNIWLEQVGGRVKLLDFGLARACSEQLQLTQPGAIVGTPAYMAPEQAESSDAASTQSDLFSLGCVLYRMSTGEAAFKGDGMYSILKALETHNPDPPVKVDATLPPAFSGLVMQLLAKAPHRRPKSAQEVIDRINWIETKSTNNQLVEAPTVPEGLNPPAPPPAAIPMELPKAVPVEKAGTTPDAPAKDSPSAASTAVPLRSDLRAGSPEGASVSEKLTDSVLLDPFAPAFDNMKNVSGAGLKRSVPRVFWLGIPLAVLLLVSGIFAISQFAGSGENGDGDEAPVKGKQNKLPEIVQPKALPLPTFKMDPTQHVFYQYNLMKRFGLNVTTTGKTLTFKSESAAYSDGLTNTTVVRIDRNTDQFGDPVIGSWISSEDAPPAPKRGVAPDVTKSKNIWHHVGENVKVTQVLDVVSSKQPVKTASGQRRWQRDTVVVVYCLENASPMKHSVGLRVLLDTKVGNNDNAPFAVPHLPELVKVQGEYRANKVPAFIQAFEFPSLFDPGTIAQLQFDVGAGIERPEQVSLTDWPGDIQTRLQWAVPLVPISFDSCVVLYWNDKDLNPGEKRYVGFACGLGRVSTTKAAKSALGVTLGGRFAPKESFVVMTYVDNPDPKEKLELILPKGLKLVEGSAQQKVPIPFQDRISVVTWQVRAEKEGDFEFTVQSSTGLTHRQAVFISEADPKKRLTSENVLD